MAFIKNTLTRHKLVLSLGLIITSVVYAVWQHANDSGLVTTTSSSSTGDAATNPSKSLQEANAAIQQTLSQITISSIPTPAATAPVQPSSMMRGRGAMMGLYADGSYTGSAADAYYGTVQVKAVIQGSKITDVVFLQYPNDRSNSISINSQAMPLLTQEAIQAQSAQVDGVSGATFTSGAFKESLAAALALAKK